MTEHSRSAGASAPESTRTRFPVPVVGPVWRGMMAWFRNVPIADPVDRRNAPMLQLISLMLAVLPSLAWLYRIFAVDIPWRPGELAGLLLTSTVCAAAAAAFFLIRRGAFAWASRLLLLVFAVTVVPAYLASGFGAQRFEQPVLVIWMAIAGLIIGRSALWIMFSCIALAFAVGIWVDIGRQGDAAALIGDAAFSIAMFLMIAVVMDRSSAALRESLKEANARGAALAQSNRLLQEEMREREQAQERLIHAQKMEAAGRLASGVAHDFGNLLSLIQGHVQTGKRSASLEQALQSLTGVESAAKRAAAVSGKLLSFSRQDQTRPEVFDAAAALTQMQPMLRQLFDPTVTLTFPEAPSAQRIRFDRTQFELLVLNLAANAQHAMPEGGLFAMQAPHAEGPVVLLFRDTGPGIPPEVQARIFDPFFTTKPAGQGTGLGLAVVKDLVEAAGGQVQVESGAEIGTTLRLEFPRQV